MMQVNNAAHIGLEDQDVLRPLAYPIKDAVRCEVVATPKYPAGRGPEDCPSVLDLNIGDIVYVLEKHTSGWWGGHKEGDETTGWFPGTVAVPKPLPGDSVSYDGDDENSRAALERDQRAVASPQGSQRMKESILAAQQEQNEKLLKELSSEQNKVKELEAAVSMERDWKDKYAEDVRRLEFEISRVRSERDTEKQERERERREFEQKEKMQERDLSSMHCQERREQQEAHSRLEQDASDCRAALRTVNNEMARLQEQLLKKDEQMAQMKACFEAELQHRDEQKAKMQVQATHTHAVQRQSSPDVVVRRSEQLVAETSLVSENCMNCSALQGPGTPQGLGSATRDDSRHIGRQTSNSRLQTSSIQRQLFTQADEPPVSARALHRHPSEPVQSLHFATGPGGMTVPLSAVRVASAAPPRPSPRGLPPHATTLAQSTPMQAWRSQSQGAAMAASPRGAKAIAAMQGIDNRPAAQVRAIVSEIERRSTSQTPCAVSRHPDGSVTPSRPQAATRSASANGPCASIRAPSHGPQLAVALARGEPRGRRIADDDAPMSSPMASEDNTSAVVFGMSPIAGRPRGERLALRTGHISTPSPQPKGPSVQDRIRAFQTGRRH